MESSNLFDVLNSGYDCKLVSSYNTLDCDQYNEVLAHDLYMKFDLSRFTKYDTVERVILQLKFSTRAESIKFSLFETKDYELNSITKLSDFNIEDTTNNNTCVDSVILYNTNGENTLVKFDLTKLFNEKIKFGASYVSFRIYHDKSNYFGLEKVQNNENIVINRSTFIGNIKKLKLEQYDKMEMGNIGTSNVYLYNSLLKFNLPIFDSGNKVLPLSFTGTYHNYYHTNKSLIGDFFMSNFEYKININDNYIRLINYNLEERIFHRFKKYDDFDEADYFRNYKCNENELYYSNINKHEFISLLNPNSNIQTIRYVNNNIMYKFDYNRISSKLYLKEINFIREYNNLNNVKSDKIILTWSSLNLLENIKLNNTTIFEFIYNNYDTIEKVWIPKNKTIISLTYQESTEGYITISNIKVYKNNSSNLTGLTPYINNNYNFDSFYGIYKLRSVYDNINNIGYEYTYPFTYSNEIAQNNVIKISEITGLLRYKTYNRFQDYLCVNTNYNDITKYYFDTFYNNHLIIDKYNRYKSMYYDIKYNCDICNFKTQDFKNGTILLNNVFNEINNGLPTNWSLTNRTNQDQIILNEYLPEIIGTNIFRINGDFESEKVFSQEITFDKINDSFETWQFSLWYKCKTTINQITKVNISITNTDNTINSYDFNMYSFLDGFQVYSGNFESKKCYKKIKFSIIYKGYNELYVGNIRLYKLVESSNYDINDNNQIESIISNNSNIEYIYDKFNRIFKVIGSNGEIYNYEYDDRNNVVSIKSSQTKEKIEYNYDINGNLIEYTITSVNGNELSKTYVYNENNEMIQETDEKGNITNYSYSNCNINFLTDSNNNKVSYDHYDNRSSLKKRTISNNNNVIESYENIYDSNNNIERIKCNNLTIYDFLYDTYNRLEIVENNYYSIIQFLYNLINNCESDLIYEKRYTTGYYRYTYDSRNRLEYIKQVLYRTIDCYKFEYDNLDRITKIIDYINNEEKTFIYDENSNVIEYFNKKINDNNKYIDVNCIYDNSSQLQKKTISFNDIKNSYEFDYINEYNTFNSRSFVLRFVSKNTCDYILGQNVNLSYGQEPIYSHVDIEYDENLKQYIVNNKYLNGTLTYKTDFVNEQRRNLRSYSGVEYDKNEWVSKFLYTKCMYGYFKIEESSSYNLMFLTCDLYNEYVDSTCYQLRIDNDLKLSLYKGIADNSCFPEFDLLFKTNLSVQLNKWNLIGVKFESKKITIYYNNTSDVFEFNNTLNLLNYNKIGLGTGLVCIEDQDTYFGEARKTNIVSSLKVLCFCIDNDFAHSESYLEGDKYLNNNFYINPSSKVCYYNNKIFDYDIDVISLNGNFNSINNNTPYIKTENLYNYKDKKYKLFEYDRSLNKIVYGSLYKRENGISNKPIVSYNLNLGTTGSIGMMFKLDVNNIQTSRTLFASYDNESNLKVELYITKYGLLILRVGTSNKYICEVTNDKWHYICLCWDANSTYLRLNNRDYTLDDISINLNNCITYLASTNSGDRVINGYMQMFVYSNQKLTDTQIDDIYSDGIIEIKNNYDINGRISTKEVKSNKYIMNKEYNYDNTNVINNLIKSETLFNGNIITYTHDNNNNICSKTITNGDTSTKEVYIYDSVNRLISEEYYGINNLLSYKYNYTYDTNGNILSKEKINRLGMQEYINNYIYSNTVHDMLLEVKQRAENVETTIFKLEYDNSLYPYAYTKNGTRNILEWECDKLTKFGDCTFKYNENGLRTKKSRTNGNYVLYYYDGNTIYCSEHKINNTIKHLYYHYDENGTVSGLHYNNSEYIYDRDSTGNIINILDLYGKTMVKYTYTSYGIPIKSLGNSLTTEEQIIANDLKDLNIFIYKGYVYDEETQLYWVSSRYYSPELCRWISPDDIEYLDLKLVNGLNLYCYCMNNPIMYVDPSGCIAISTILISIAIGSCVSFGSSYISDVIENMKDGFHLSDFNTFEENWKKYICSAVGGAISGAFGAFNNSWLSFIGNFIGGIIENSYTFNNSQNITDIIWTNLLSASLDGILDVFANKISSVYFNNSLSELSKDAKNQFKKYLKNGTNITNIHAIKLKKKTELLNVALKGSFDVFHKFITIDF